MSKWELCCNCDGEGKHSNALGVIDTQEWDGDDLDLYMNGGYDATCEFCRGTGKVLEGNNRPHIEYASEHEFYCKRDGGY
jgi:uncharacterized Fe-S cluster protein YjdI